MSTTGNASETAPGTREGTPVLDLTQDVAQLTADLLDIHSVSDHEGPLADAVEAALSPLPHLRVTRHGDTVVARTELGRSERVVLAGHLDTVPLPTTEGSRGTVPSRWEDEDGRRVLYGRGATDMKGGVAVQLALAASLAEPVRDVTYVFYDHEEVASASSGLGKLLRSRPELVTDADFAVLLEPTAGTIEGGCNGTLRFWIRSRGLAAHSARAWKGENAIHALQPALAALCAYEPATVGVEGLDYREGLNAVEIRGGTAGNVIPDACDLHVNYRFAPDKTLEEAIAHVEEVFAGYELDVVDRSPAARPGLDAPMARELVEAVGAEPAPKYGWTDVARFSALGIPAVNFGPGDPLLCHTDDEHVDAEDVRACRAALADWLTTTR
ncbi:succinyl-diaminopimelate desuccinylase [Rothia sp. AR01]|uniref:Succinyl-diaminopimelate desuccinylase n=1 Tax=Rothia santali TaxID=2949643 RepID=A0A9X2HI22_9MICC|nr:succinyl-diaminopimelate desuccinylase [Rothia santali]MCP3426091.1 succinyl-diaminopimelate desuccinylase [Rothia santali]